MASTSSSAARLAAPRCVRVALLGSVHRGRRPPLAEAYYDFDLDLGDKYSMQLFGLVFGYLSIARLSISRNRYWEGAGAARAALQVGRRGLADALSSTASTTRARTSPTTSACTSSASSRSSRRWRPPCCPAPAEQKAMWNHLEQAARPRVDAAEDSAPRRGGGRRPPPADGDHRLRGARVPARRAVPGAVHRARLSARDLDALSLARLEGARARRLSDLQKMSNGCRTAKVAMPFAYSNSTRCCCCSSAAPSPSARARRRSVERAVRRLPRCWYVRFQRAAAAALQMRLLRWLPADTFGVASAARGAFTMRDGTPSLFRRARGDRARWLRRDVTFLVANELEDPFGADHNDLPVVEEHRGGVHRCRCAPCCAGCRDGDGVWRRGRHRARHARASVVAAASLVMDTSLDEGPLPGRGRCASAGHAASLDHRRRAARARRRGGAPSTRGRRLDPASATAATTWPVRPSVSASGAARYVSGLAAAFPASLAAAQACVPPPRRRRAAARLALRRGRGRQPRPRVAPQRRRREHLPAVAPRRPGAAAGRARARSARPLPPRLAARLRPRPRTTTTTCRPKTTTGSSRSNAMGINY